MTEVELKFEILLHTWPGLQEKLDFMKCEGLVENFDIYYDTPGFELLQQAVFVRARNRHRLEFKFNKSAEASHIQSTERVFPLMPEPYDAEQMSTLFTCFLPGWHTVSSVEEAIREKRLVELARIENRRMQYRHEEIILSIDHVKGLGDYLEVEVQCEEGQDTSKALSALERFVSDLFLRPLHVGYVELWLHIHRPSVYRLGRYHVEAEVPL